VEKDFHARWSRVVARAAAPAGALLACAALAGPAAAHGPSKAPRAQGETATKAERRLLNVETQLLGTRHAREHAMQRKLSGRKRKLKPRRLLQAGTPAEVGRWNAPFKIPLMAIHAAMLPTGKVLWYGYYERNFVGTGERYGGTAWTWDPATGATNKVDPPSWVDPVDGQTKVANVFCSSASFLGDGQLLVAGGNLEYPNNAAGTYYKGLNKLFTFDPYTETWVEQPNLARGRWYPSQVLMPDGRVAILSGYDELGTKKVTKELEVFTPAAQRGGRGTVQTVARLDATNETSAVPPIPSLYPHLFTMPSGRVLSAGPHPWDSWFMNSVTPFSWSDARNPMIRYAGTGVLEPTESPAGTPRVSLIGGYNDKPALETRATSEWFDETQPAAGWTAGSAMQVGRAHHNTVLLPDRTMVTIGGGKGDVGGDLWQFDAGQLNAELYDPVSRTWKLGPPQQEGRTYHSTAVLLPDGRVVSAGDDVNGGKTSDTAEIYEPPYLHKGVARPRLTNAPASVRWGASFTAETPDAVTKAVLIAPSVVTHSVDMNQRYVQLAVTQRADRRGVDLLAPPNPNVAPPGPYMLFLLNAQGVPSVARFVILNASGTAAALPPGAAPPPGGGAGGNSGGGGTSSGKKKFKRTLGSFENKRLVGWRTRGRVRAARPGYKSRYAMRLIGSRARASKTIKGLKAGRYKLTYWLRGRVASKAGGKTLKVSARKWKRVTQTARVRKGRVTVTFTGRGRSVARVDDVVLRAT